MNKNKNKTSVKCAASNTPLKVKSKRSPAKGELTEYNMYLFHEGKNYEAFDIMGSHIVKENGKHGVRFTTWAPKAEDIWVVCDRNEFSIDDSYKMKKITDNGIWSIFIEGIDIGEKYKFAIKDMNENIVFKSDPYAIESELRPNTASIVYKPGKFKWSDKKWISSRNRKSIYRNAMNIYEVHLGSWRTKNGEFMTYDEISEVLPKYVEDMGYTHVEFMPLAEYPFDKSWGYQVTGYYSLTSRYGNIEGFKKLVDKLHSKNIGVILDWVPGHFCKDIHGLYLFDGTPTYEYEEFWKADNKGWGTFNFDLGKPEVKSYLISNALYWLKEFHLDGLRVDAVANMLYLSYGRKDGEWIPNKDGNDKCLEAVEFIKNLNETISEYNSHILMIAEESTAWPKVTGDISDGGLGFKYKWNMGWMNDILQYMKLSPEDKKYNHKMLNFSMMYNYNENFILPISHDEVVHGKMSLISKMYGDWWNQFSGLRLLLTFMIGHPGKKLCFMGAEFGQFIEWRYNEQLEWKLIDEFPMHKMTQDYVRKLNHFYKDNRALWELDDSVDGFTWIDANNNEQCIASFIRRGRYKKNTLIFVCNFSPNVYYDFKVGVPYLEDYVEVLNSDKKEYGGSGQIMGDVKLSAEEIPMHGQPYSIQIKVPPMGAIILGLSNGR